MLGTSTELQAGVTIMPGKTTNPLTQDGLAAKIVNFCFLQPRNGYNLALQIYGNNNPSRIYEYLDKFGNYFNINDGKYYVLSEPIVKELQKLLERNNAKLNEYEFRVLMALMESPYFRHWFGSAIGLEFLARQGHNIVSAISSKFARDSTLIIILRRQGKLPYNNKAFPSMAHFLKWFDEQLALQERSPVQFPEYEDSKQHYSSRINSKRALFEDLFPEVAKTDLSYETMKRESENHLNYFIALSLLPDSLLKKLLNLNRDAAKDGLWSALFHEVKQ